MERTLDALQTPGRSVFIFGERGVGKTSLARSATNAFNGKDRETILVACSEDMTFPQLIGQVTRKLLSLPILEGWKARKLTLGLNSPLVALATTMEKPSSMDAIAKLDVNDAVDVLNEVTGGVTEPISVVIDELDVVQHKSTRKHLAHFLKQLGDKDCSVKFVLVGIADDMSQLLEAHESASRYIASVKLERLGLDTMAKMLEDGFSQLGTDLAHQDAIRIACISDGFAHYVHLVGLKLAMQWIAASHETEVSSHLRPDEGMLADALAEAVADSEAWLSAEYNTAVQKYRDKYEPVLWSVADHRELIRSTEQMYEAYERICRSLMKEPLTRPLFSNALNKFKTEPHGHVLTSNRRSWYRFRHTMLRGYCRMIAATKGVALGMQEITTQRLPSVLRT